ncbi:DUF6599 family protein [Gemmatimonadota bacterium]
MNRSRFLLLMPAFIILTLTAWHAPQGGDDVMSLVPQPDTDQGWQWDFEPEVFTPENLYEYINGEAEVYNDYEFIEMVTASHARHDDPLASVTFDIYDMGTILNAFGIYSNYRRPELTFGEIGEEAIVSDLNLRFWKGRFFVQVNAGSMEEVVKNALPAYAAKIADSIKQVELPATVFILPEEGQVPHSLRYMARGMLGQEAFTRSFEAKYLLPSGECTAFLVPKDSPGEARAALASFIGNLHQQGQVEEMPDPASLSTFSADTEYYGSLTARLSGNYVVGVIRYHDRAEAAILIAAIEARLR